MELDLRMAAVAARHAKGVAVINGRAEVLPLASASVDAVVASSAWHWIDPKPALTEIARVLRPGGSLGVVWNGPARRIDWVGRLLGGPRDTARARRQLVIPSGLPFSSPEHRIIHWSLARTPAQLVGLAGTYSTMAGADRPERREAARRVAELIESHPTLRRRSSINLPMAARCWRATRLPERGP